MFNIRKNIIEGALNTGEDLGGKKIRGKVILIRKNDLNFTQVHSPLLDGFAEILGAGVSFQLISATHASIDSQGIVGKRVFLERWLTSLPLVCPGESVFQVSFTWEDNFGFPGAFFIRNSHTTEFFLKSLTLEDVPGFGRVHFDCNSWVYPFGRYKRDRVFFANSTYLPSETPNPLRKYREEELLNLRGDWIIGERREWDRIYGYDVYSDLVDPYGGVIRPILGGCEYPYPRCGRTWGPRPRRDFLIYSLKSLASSVQPVFINRLNTTLGEFEKFQFVHNLFEGGFPVPLDAFRNLTKGFTQPMFQDELLRRDGESFLKFPPPQVLREDMSAWRTDEEFTREILAGVNPLIIRRLKEFPPLSKLDPQIYGDQNSKITEEDIKYGLEGLSVHEAINQNKLFILDHHDALMPYLRKINSTSPKTYATRTLLFLKADGILRPLAIELSLPHPHGDQFGANSKLYFPAEGGVENSIWQLAKTYVAVNDAGYHQLISHWLNVHAIQKHFVIATHRHLSVLHPIHKLLVPHYKDTMFINAFARQVIVNADSLLESTHLQSKYAMELSSYIYKEWNFLEQALPANLIKRGVAIEDASSPHGLRLLIEDYPFAVDGLEIWSTIKTWVTNYCSLYYRDDMAIQNDIELQSWWKEAREKGHADKKNEPWWPKMQTFDELVETCTIIIWISSTLHAADNFGQYPYEGYVPNRPTISRRLMAVAGSAEYKELESKPEKAFLRTTNSQLHIPLGVSLIEILSRQVCDEVYLGQRASFEWTSDKAALEAFENFWKEVLEVENRIIERNKYVYLKNRTRPANMSCMLRPSSAEGLIRRGIPNSISILSRL